MHARTFSATLHGIDGRIIEIEAACQRSIPRIQIVGLPGDIVKESRDRVQACLNTLGFEVPSERIVVHLSPAETRKQGSQFDLAIALSVLAAEGMLRSERLPKFAFLGELALDGRIKAVSYLLPLLDCLEKSKAIEEILIPVENGAEAVALGFEKVRGVSTLSEVIDSLREGRPFFPPLAEPPEPWEQDPSCLDKVRGQGFAKRALQVALAGRHSLLMIGPPGIGKTMLAQCAPHLLPRLSREEAIESAKILSLSSGPALPFGCPPFRAPHHTTSAAGLLGGGSGAVVPGEVTFAHHGALFLDEFPEFSRPAIEGLREPLQNGSIEVHRVGNHYSFPARFTLLVAMNPCPCGYFFSGRQRCRCSPELVANYRRKVSGPLLDRIDLLVVMASSGTVLDSGPNGRDIAEAIQRVRGLDRILEMEAATRARVESFLASGTFSYRSLEKMERVARTIAQLEGQDRIELKHLLEAKQLRCPESLARYWS